MGNFFLALFTFCFCCPLNNNGNSVDNLGIIGNERPLFFYTVLFFKYHVYSSPHQYFPTLSKVLKTNVIYNAEKYVKLNNRLT